jgi:hypothetical protein
LDSADVKNAYLQRLSHENNNVREVCVRRKAANDFLNTIFPLLLRLLINVNLNAALQRKGMEIGTFLR